MPNFSAWRTKPQYVIVIGYMNQFNSEVQRNVSWDDFLCFLDICEPGGPVQYIRLYRPGHNTTPAVSIDIPSEDFK